jgi:hypothetical protein
VCSCDIKCKYFLVIIHPIETYHVYTLNFLAGISTLSRNHKLFKNHTVYSSSIWIVCWICCRSMVQISLLTKYIFNNVTIKPRWNNFRMQFFNARSSRVSMVRRLLYLLLAVSFWQPSFSQDLSQLYEILSLINLSSHISFTGLTSVKKLHQNISVFKKLDDTT